MMSHDVTDMSCDKWDIEPNTLRNIHVHVHILLCSACVHVCIYIAVHDIVKKYTADYDKALIFNKVHHELNQVPTTAAV